MVEAKPEGWGWMIPTLGNPRWVRENHEKLRAAFPETWTHASNLNLLKLGYQFKLLNLDWRSEEQLSQIFAACEKMTLIQRDGVLIRRNHHFVCP